MRCFWLGVLAVLAGCGDVPEEEEEATSGELVVTCPEHDNCDQRFCEQVPIEGGQFEMGSNHPPHEDTSWTSGDERPRHHVYVDPFCIDKYEVTLKRYESCVDAGVCTPDGLLWRNISTTVNHYPPECYGDLNACKNRAVNGKNYGQAKDYCEWIGGRLCTEAEWERAANGPGPDRRRNPWGGAAPSSDLVNIPSTGTGFVEEVDDYPDGVSAEGVFNLAGNVYEWVEDAYDLYADSTESEPLINPSNPPESADVQAVGRGSCFFTEPHHTVAERTIFDQTFDWG